jgi:ribose transport system permease protein
MTDQVLVTGPQPNSPATGPGGGEQRSVSLLTQIATKYGVLVALLLLIVFFSIARPSAFPTWANAITILQLASPLAVVAIGVTVPMAVGDFDLSISGMMSLGSAIAVVLMVSGGVNWIVAIIIAVIIGMLLGSVVGYAVSYLGASSFIVTLAAGQIFLGGQYLLIDQATIFQGIPQAFIDMTAGPRIIVYPAVLAVIMYVWLDRMEGGRLIYAIGINPTAARFAGVRVRWWRLVSFSVVAAFAVFGGCMVASTSAAETPGLGSAYLLPVYAAVFLGSVVLKPGRFTILGTVVGVLFLQVLQTGLAMMSLSGSVILIIQGGVLAAAIIFAQLGRKTRRS